MSSTVNVKLTTSYDGTEFHGFQAQLSGIPTIAGELVKAITKITGHEIELVCAGRTDKGVHAEGQIVNFVTTKTMLKEHNWVRAINSILPRTIRITACEFKPLEFSSRFDAKAREYWYYINNARYPDAIHNRFTTHVFQELSVDKLNEYCSEFIGEHDFSAFCSALDASATKVRRIYSYSAVKEGDIIILKIKGSAFLHNMVRILTGTLIDLHKKNADASRIREIIDSKNRNLAGSTMPPDGLIFKKVYYEEITT